MVWDGLRWFEMLWYVSSFKILFTGTGVNQFCSIAIFPSLMKEWLAKKYFPFCSISKLLFPVLQHYLITWNFDWCKLGHLLCAIWIGSWSTRPSSGGIFSLGQHSYDDPWFSSQHEKKIWNLYHDLHIPIIFCNWFLWLDISCYWTNQNESYR